MKKRLLSALLALALVFVLLPTTALADTTPVTDENVKINGTAVIVGNNISLGEGNGTYSYDKATHTLTLNSATINATGSNIGIEFCDTTNYVTYSVILTGENTVTSNNIAIETTPNTNLTFTGGGNLKAITNGYYQAIRVYGTLTIDNSTLIAESSAYTATTVIWTLAMTGNNAKLEISNKSAANIVAGTAGPASNIDWSNYQFTTGSYSGDALTESDPEVCSWGTLKKYFGYPTKEYSQYICIAKRTIPALTKTSDVLIAGKDAVVGVETSIPSANGSGTYYYDQASKTLTLNNVTITSGTNAIQFAAAGTYTVKLEGTNKISNVSNGISVTDDKYITSLNVTITGTGSLDISAKGLAINMKKGDLKFENTGAIKLATSSIGLNNNALSVKGNITITDMSKYSVTGTQQTGGKPLGSEVSLTEASQLKGGTTGYRIITITPAAAKPSTISYGGKTLTQGQIINGENGGTATVAAKGNTITLNNFNGTQALSFEATLADSTLVLEGTNTLSSIVTKKMGLTISGSGSLTAGSIKVTNNDNIRADLTITDGAAVIAKSNEKRAIDIDGDLTVTNGSLTATSNSNNVPTVQVGGNASFTGSTVTITNNSTALHKDAAGSTKGDSVSSALYVKGNINTDNANVTAKVENGGGNAIGAVGNITVNGSTVTAVNKGQKFTTIIAENVYVSGDSKITANNLNKNPPYKDSYLAFPAIEGKIVNQNTDYSLKFEGQHSRTSVPKTTLAPGEQTTLYYYNVTITRGDEVTRTNSPVVIAGTTLLNDTFYTINGSTVAEGTESNYNAVYDSKTKTLKLNNASINGTGVKAIEANVGGYTFTIELVGNNIIKTSGFANNVIDITGNLYFTGSGTAEVSGKGTPIYATYKIDVSADVTITNTEKAGSFTFSAYGENSSNYKGANTFAIGTGYTAYATTDKTTWAVYDNTTASENESYTTLRITTQPPETGGGSTHQHTWDTTKWYDVGDGYHANKCTGCDEYDLTNKKAHVAWPDESKGSEGHTEKCMLCDYKYDQSVIKPHEWTGWWVSDYQPEVHAQRCNCGYQNSVHSTLKYVAIDSNYHQKQCPIDGCGYKIEYKTSHVYEEGSNICTECGYDKSAPCDHTGDLVYTNNGDGTHKVTCKACGATLFEKQNHKFDPATGACVCGATQSGGDPTPDNPGTIVIIRPAEEEKPAQQPNPSTGANDLVGLAVAAAVAAALGSAALLRKHD